LTLIEAALKVLKTENMTLTAEEIYDLICKASLYTFGAKDPLSILYSEIGRHSVGFTGKKAASSTVKEDPNTRYTPLQAQN
jgi:hypothetical protein